MAKIYKFRSTLKNRQAKTNQTEPSCSNPSNEGLSPLYEKATIAMQRGRWSEGEKLWRELLTKAPDFHPAYHNLAIALIQQKRNAEAETCLRKAMELDPNYVFAPCTLTIIYLREGRTSEARTLIDTVIVQDNIHPSAMATYCSAQCQVAMAEKEIEKAIEWLDLGAKVDPGNRSIKELRKSLRIPIYMQKVLSKFQSRAEKEKRLRRKRVLSKDAPLADCYEMYSPKELAGMARAIGVNAKSMQKEDVLSAICAVLEKVESVHLIQGNLSPEEKTALQEVINAGGRMDYETFTSAHGSDADDAFGWKKQPQSLLGRLKCRGLLVEATIDRRPSVFIPSRIPLIKE